MGGCSCCSSGCGKDVRVSFCPKCKSKSVGYVFGLGNLFGIIPKMKCRDCAFEAQVFPVLIANEDELKNAIEGMKAKKVVSKKNLAKKKTSKKKVVKNKKKVVKK